MTHIDVRIDDKTYPSVGRAGAHQAIKDLRLTLDAGEFVCLIGPSGCGKTTLLNIIAGLDADYRGEIVVGERHAQPRIGYVFQNPRLLPWRTVRQNIELVMPEPRNVEIVDFLLAAMQLTHAQHVYPERLSLGMSRRVAIIRAFAVDPDLLLLDEPFVSLDSPTARQVRELLLGLWRQRPHTVLFVTHDLREAITLADRLVFLSPAPTAVLTGIKVPIPRDERNRENAVEEFRRHLIENHPQISRLL